ncbi:MAG: hypothetical protein JXA28_15605 [Bacteroidetes bacterium]|nr:hypothetical protein [Bacteroidota bacterium]
MQIDMHYYGLGFLARAAGLPEKDALTLAYASQYVDDATESTPMNCGDFMFDPVRTAHNGLGANSWTVQRKIHMPFHFIPPEPLTSKPDAFITQPDSPMSQRLLDRARTETDHESKIIALGIAMHTYADTWAHSGFAGKEDDINDVQKMLYKKNGRWKKPGLDVTALNLLPPIGHVQASSYPDLPWVEWKYRSAGLQKNMPRNNHALFLDAAKNIHNYICWLSEATEPITAWTTIAKEVSDTLAIDDDRIEIRIRGWIELWTKYFGSIAGKRFHYHKLIWRNEAFDSRYKGKTDWDTRTREEMVVTRFHPIKDFWNTRWVKYHRMALRQRNLVLEELW